MADSCWYVELDASTTQDCDNMVVVEDDIGSMAIMNSGMMTRSRLGIAGKTDPADRQVNVNCSDTRVNLLSVLVFA